jgi:hypothetical protein
MGFYQTWRNNLRFIGHDGDLVAFHSMFLLEPVQKLVIFVSYNSAGSAGKNRTELLDGFADRYFPAYTATPFQTIPVDQLKDIAGNYESTRRADSTKTAISNPASQGVATVDKDGVLTVDVYKDLRGHTRKWKPIGKDLWQIEDEQGRLFAIRDSSGKIVRLAVSFPGVQFQRVPWYENKTFVGVSGAASVLILLAVVLTSLIRFGRKLFFRNRPPFKAQAGTLWISIGSRIAAFLWIIVCIWLILLATNLQNEALPSFPTIVRYFSLITWFSVLAALFSIFALIAGIRIWTRADVRFISRLKFGLVTLACVFLTWYAFHWNLIGPIHRF